MNTSVAVLSHVAVIIRTYGNNPDITKSVSRALEKGAGLVIVVTKEEDPSWRGNTRAWLKGIMDSYVGRVVLIEMHIGYSWSNALNVAFAHVRKFNRLAAMKEAQPIDFILTVSNETLWERLHLDAMLAAMHESSRVGAVGTSFDGRQEGTPVDLGTSYRHPRNTMMLIRWEAFLAVGHFDAVCDQAGGMEDLHFILEMLLSGNFTWNMLDLRVRLLIGKNYNQGLKEQRERDAMAVIVNAMRNAALDAPEVSARLEPTLQTFGLA